MHSRLRHFCANAALSVVSFLLTYLVCELLFFRFMLPSMSYNIRPHLPDRADFFMQNSKSHYAPHDYIALLGDSYAAGVGDWLLAGGGVADKPYHSANVIHDLTGRDVASFGRVNIGSAQAMVQRVTRILDDDYCYLFPAIETPSRFVVYFYEGNDFADNYELLLDDIKPREGDLGAQVDAFLRDRYARPSPWACHGHFGDMLWRMGRYAVKYAGRPPPPVIDLAATMNPVVLGGETRMAADFQAPPLLMSETEIGAAVTVYARSLAWLRGRFPAVPVTVVYVPSAPSVYRHGGDTVMLKQVFAPGDPGGPAYRFGVAASPAAIYARSEMACTRIREATPDGVAFIDARPAFRKAAATAFLHGPRDWNHPNELGYRTLGALVAARLDQRTRDGCDPGASE
jgi:hypothetical protein